MCRIPLIELRQGLLKGRRIKHAVDARVFSYADQRKPPLLLWRQKRDGKTGRTVFGKA